MGIGNTTAATTLIATLTDTEPVAVVGRGTGIDDAGWSRKTAAVRDAMYRGRRFRSDPVALLRTCGGADLAAESDLPGMVENLKALWQDLIAGKVYITGGVGSSGSKMV